MPSGADGEPDATLEISPLYATSAEQVKQRKPRVNVGPGAVLCEATGGLGLHVWALLAEPSPAASVLALMDAALARAGLEVGARVEVGEGICWCGSLIARKSVSRASPADNV